MATSLSCSSSSSRKGSASPSVSVICEEVFDETCQPSEEEINDYAALLGIDPIKESHLLYLAKEGLMQALPSDWKICYSEEKCGHYYYNTKTKRSQWDHPLDEVYRNLVNQARQKNSTINKGDPTLNTSTPIIDNSDDASQLDSGIRSLQGTDECDNTNNTTNEMSSPSTANVNNGAIPKQTLNTTNNSSGSSISTSGFSGGISRFLETRSKNFMLPFVPLKNSRFELPKTNTVSGGLATKFSGGSVDNCASKFPIPVPTLETKSNNISETGESSSENKAHAVTFVKPRRQIEVGLSESSAIITNSNVIVEGVAGVPPGVKSILRDSSLTDMGRTLQKEDTNNTGSNVMRDDKKSVRFHLDETKLRSSPEEDHSSSRRLTQSPEVSVNSDDDAGGNDDPWDDDDDVEEVNECLGIDNLPLDGLIGCQRSLNPFLINDDKEVKKMKVTSVSKEQTIQMLKAQSISMDLPERTNLQEMHARSQSVEVEKAASTSSPVNFLEKIKESVVVKPTYEDTDSESKGSSVRSFIINKSEQDSIASACPSNNPFDLEELGRKHSREVQQLEMKLQNNNTDRNEPRTFKIASKLVSLLKKGEENDNVQAELKKQGSETKDEDLQVKLNEKRQLWLKGERERLEESLQSEIEAIKRDHEQKLKSTRHEYDLRLTSQQHEIEESIERQLEEYRNQLEDELDIKRKTVLDEHKVHMETLQKNHTEILADMERDLKSEEEILKKNHSKQLVEMRDKLNHELELERQRMRDLGEDRLYEKMRCEKRLLEDKYRCLKEKYIRLKTDVKLSVERRNRRREAQAMQQSVNTTNNTTTTGSETERSISNKPSIGNSENRSLSYTVSNQNSVGATTTGKVAKCRKPPVPPKHHLQPPVKDQLQKIDRSGERHSTICPNNRKPTIASKYIKHLQTHDDTTSISQSDATISNKYSKGRYLPPTVPPILSDNGNSDSEAFQSNQENNNNDRNGGGDGAPQRKNQFSRLKSASTSRLNSDNYKIDRPCTPVENLRHQLQKLEDLEDQFPENTLDATYHLRYPFSDISNADYKAGTSSELEFFKHRIHLERDSVRRAKESLRTQRTHFRARQREIKQRHKTMTRRHSLDQLIQEEKELTEMEVNLHRTRALLGEKVIRLRHLEHSLLCIYEKEKPLAELPGVEQKDDTTLSDLSSHSSSGFSSTDFASGADTQNLNKRKDIYQLDSNECIRNLEILNSEIKDILDILGGKSGHQTGLPIPLISPSELSWSHLLSTGTLPTAHHIVNSNHNIQQQISSSAVAVNQAVHSIPTLADRLETYRQMASGRVQNSLMAANTIVSQNPRAVNYTTSLVERTRDLRNWLRQAKNEHELLSGMTNTLGLNGIPSSVTTTTINPAGTLTANTNGGGGAQTNL